MTNDANNTMSPAHQVINVEGGSPIRAWTVGVPFEAEARAQLERIARLPFIHRHVAVMPDVHLGKGAAVGSVIATKRAIIPAAVGVDIGCGMMAVRTSLRASALPDDLRGVRTAIEAAFLVAVPVVSFVVVGLGTVGIIAASAVGYLLVVLLEALLWREKPAFAMPRFRRARPPRPVPPPVVEPVTQRTVVAEPVPPSELGWKLILPLDSSLPQEI